MDIAAVVIVCAVLGGIAIVLTSRESARRRALLDEVAVQRGGKLVARWGRPRVELRVGDIQIACELWSTKNGSFTEWWAQLPPPGTVAFKIDHEGVLHSIGKAFGAEDVVVGIHPHFDERFVVKCKDPLLLRRLWTSTTTDLMRLDQPVSKLESDGRELHLLRPELAKSAVDVYAGIHLLVELAGADVFGIEALRALPDASFYEGEPWPYVMIAGPGEVRIGPQKQGERVRTCARAAVTDDSWRIELVDGSASEEILEQVPGAARVHAKALGDATISADRGEAVVRWRTIETDPARLVAAIAFLRALAQAPSLGVFR